MSCQASIIGAPSMVNVSRGASKRDESAIQPVSPLRFLPGRGRRGRLLLLLMFDWSGSTRPALVLIIKDSSARGRKDGRGCGGGGGGSASREQGEKGDVMREPRTIRPHSSSSSRVVLTNDQAVPGCRAHSGWLKRRDALIEHCGAFVHTQYPCSPLHSTLGESSARKSPQIGNCPACPTPCDDYSTEHWYVVQGRWGLR